MRKFRLHFALASLTIPAALATAQSVQDPNRLPPTPPSQQQIQQAQQLKLERMSQLLNMRVNTTDQQLAGTIQDFAIMPDENHIVFAVVKPEANSRFGENARAVPFDALDFQAQAARLNIGADRFQDAPPFDSAGWGKPGKSDWLRIVYQHYGFPMPAYLQTTGEAPTLLRASELQTMALHSAEAGHQRLGQLSDLAVDVRSGRIVYAITDTETARDMKQDKKFVAVPWSAVDLSPTQRVLTVSLNQDRFNKAPTFANFNELSAPAQINRNFAYYGVESDTVYGFEPPQGVPNANDRGMGGWDSEGAYDRLFDERTLETVQGTILAIERITPMANMAEGVQVRIDTSDKRNVNVHLGPSWFLNHQELPFKGGDKVTVVGSKVRHEAFPGNEGVIAQSIRFGENVLLLRDRNGTPRWDAIVSARKVPNAQ